MKIYFISHWGWGLYKSRSEIARDIKEHYEVNAVCPKDEFYEKIIDSYDNHYEWGIDRTRSNLTQIYSIFNLNKILKDHLEGNIFHVFTFKSSVLFALSLNFLRKKGTTNAISSITGLGYFFGDTKIAIVARSLLRVPLKIILKDAYNYYIFQNITDKNRLQEYLNLDKNQLKLIEGSGIDTQSIKLKKDFDKNNTDVIMATRLLKEKGVDEFLEIAKRVKEIDKNINFYLAGEVDKGNPTSLSKEEVARVENNKDVNYLGNVENLQNKLYKYDIAVTTSYHEGFSRFLLESSYVGLYCLSNNLPGTEPILRNNLHGRLIDKNNINDFTEEIIRYSQNQKIDIESVIQQRNFIEREFSISEVTKKFIDLYTKIESDG